MNVTNSDFKKLNLKVSPTINSKPSIRKNDLNRKPSSNSIKNSNTMISNKNFIQGVGKNENFSSGLSMPMIEPQQSKISNILSREDLNAMLFKVKKYYNDLKKMGSVKEKNLEVMHENLETYEKKVNDMESLKDIEFEHENISIGAAGVHETKEMIQEKIEKMMLEKKNLDEKYKNEIEYSNILSKMITVEKENLENLNEKFVMTEDKIKALKISKKGLDNNIEEEEKKNKLYKSVMKNLQEEMVNLDVLTKYQQSQMDRLSFNYEQVQKANREKRIMLENKNHEKEVLLKQEKENVISELKKVEEIKLTKMNKEREIIKLILGLDIIKKYYVDMDKDGKEINNQILLKSDDYKIFTADRYSLLDYDNATVILQTTSNATEHDVKETHCATSSNNIKHPEKYSKIYLKDIKSAFDNFDIDYETLYNFYSKIINKTSFYHHNMMTLNLKIIKLENLKDVYTIRVQNIMKNNYKNFDDLVKNNSRFSNFMKNYQDELKIKSEMKKNKILLSDLNAYFSNNSFPHGSESANNVVTPRGARKIVFPPLQYSDLYKKCNDVISVIKAFYEFILNKLKNIFKENAVRSDKHLDDNLKRCIKLIEARLCDTATEFSKVPKDIYVNDVLKFAESETDEWKSKIQAESNISIETLREFIFNQKNKEVSKKFFELTLPLEKVFFYFYSKYSTAVEIIGMIYQTVDSCSNKYKNSNRMEEGKNLGKEVPEEELERMMSFWNRRGSDNRAKTVDINNFRQKEEDGENSYLSGEENVEINNNRTQKNFMRYSASKNGDSAPLPQLMAKTSTNFNINKKISDKFYMPFIKKKAYNIKLNEKMSEIKKNTRQSAYMSHFFTKKKKEIDGIAKELILYNNPSKIIQFVIFIYILFLDINLDSLSNNTYNSFVKYIINHQVEIKNDKDRENKI
jgi:hypothetical protein